jgi:hypothetical protein
MVQTAHTARKSMDVVPKIFPEYIISLRGELSWPAISPDLSASVSFFWRYLKAKVYTTRPWTIDDLKIAIGSQFQRYQKTW